jgi:peroxiredoxin
MLEDTVSGKISLDTEAPDFSLSDYSGQRINLSDFRGKQHVILVFNRGFK